MFKKHQNQSMALGAIAVALLVSAVSVAQNVADRDAKEINNYVLTEAALAKYTQAVHNLAPLMKNLPGACDDSEDARSLNDAVARMDAIPAAKAAIRSAGLTTREYVVFTWSMFQNGVAAWSLDQPGGKLPPGTLMGNVNFYRAHDAALRKLGKELKAADCDDEDRTDESD